MAFRDKVKRVLHRSHGNHSNNNPRPNTNANGIKIEYYKRHEIPKSKFKGPFDPEHQKKLAAWNFQKAQEDRPRSPDLSLSPCATLPPQFRPSPPENTEGSGLFDSTFASLISCSSPTTNVFSGSPSVTHDEYAHRQGTESQSSTAVDSDSHNASMMTLPVESYRNDSIARIKESTLHTSPVRAISSHAVPKAKQMPFSPDDLSRALNAAHICT